jgi:hypothetical protein
MYDAICKGFGSFQIPADGPMTWLNADDILLPNSLATILKLFSAHPDIDWITGARQVIDENGSVVLFDPGAYAQVLVAQGLCESGTFTELQQEGTFWRKKLWDTVGGLDASYQLAGDWDLWRRFAHRGELLHVPYALGCFRRHGNQRSTASGRYYTEIDESIPPEERAARFRRLEPRLAELTVKWLTAGETVTEESAVMHLPVAIRKHRSDPMILRAPGNTKSETQLQDVRSNSLSLIDRRKALARMTLAHLETVTELKQVYESLGRSEFDLLELKNSKSLRIGRSITYPIRLLRHAIHDHSVCEAKKAADPSEANLPTSVGVDLGEQLGQFYGMHRSGWAYVVTQLSRLQNSGAIYLDTFIERTFRWHPSAPNAIQRPWIGFIHVPPNVPGWFHGELANSEIFSSEEWELSQPYCRGLFTLSDYHRLHLEKVIDLPVNSILHPTEFTDRLWSWEAFKSNKCKKLLQVGWWLRKLNAIFEAPPSSYKKILVRVTKEEYVSNLIEHEREIHREAGIFNDSMLSTVEVLDYLENKDYDALLSENVVFLDLYDASANNTVIECIARCTPLLVNRLPAVMEYLGEDYPLYYSTYEEAVEKAENYERIRYAHQYLHSLPIRAKLTGDYFIESFINSEIYQSNCAVE